MGSFVALELLHCLLDAVLDGFWQLTALDLTEQFDDGGRRPMLGCTDPFNERGSHGSHDHAPWPHLGQLAKMPKFRNEIRNAPHMGHGSTCGRQMEIGAEETRAGHNGCEGGKESTYIHRYTCREKTYIAHICMYIDIDMYIYIYMYMSICVCINGQQEKPICVEKKDS